MPGHRSVRAIRPAAGSGLVGAAGTASAASAIAPECVFAIITVVHNLLLSAQFKVLLYALAETDPSGGSLILAGLSLFTGAVCMAMYTFVLRRLEKQEDARGGEERAPLERE